MATPVLPESPTSAPSAEPAPLRMARTVSFVAREQPAAFLRNHCYTPRHPKTPVPPLLPLRRLGPATIPNTFEPSPYVDRIVTMMTPLFETDEDGTPSPLAPPEFAAVAGPQSHLFFDPSTVTAGIVTCGGLCPGLNNVIRSLVHALKFAYGVPKVLGFKYGYEGMVPPAEPVEITEEMVKDAHNRGGSILGSSRGAQPSGPVVDTLVSYGVNVLFTIGGDGTLQGALEIAREIERRDLKIAVIGVPKTIDNDIPLVDATFGFQTAVARSQAALTTVHEEARSARGGVGVVKLMGRDAGFVSLHATLSNGDVNMVLLPEVKFDLDAVLAHVERRVRNRGHCVLCVAEGAGQHLFKDMPDEYDRSGNRLQHDIGRLLTRAIDEHLKKCGLEHTVKFVDPSYMIRATAAVPADALLCVGLATNAVHAALAGITSAVIVHHHNTFSIAPIDRVVHFIKRVNPQGPLYRTMLDATGMPANLAAGVPPTPRQQMLAAAVEKQEPEETAVEHS